MLLRAGSGRAGRDGKGLARSGAAGEEEPVDRVLCQGAEPHPAPLSPCQVVYQVPLRENHVSKRNVDQQLRIKIVYDRSVEE